MQMTQQEWDNLTSDPAWEYFRECLREKVKLEMLAWSYGEYEDSPMAGQKAVGRIQAYCDVIGIDFQEIKEKLNG